MCLLKCRVLRNIALTFVGLAVVCPALAQEAPQKPEQPQVKVNMLNVCAPGPEDKQEIASALAKLPKQPVFRPDFEVDRGRTSLDEAPGFLQPGAATQMAHASGFSTWVRIRREFSGQAAFSTVQYSFSQDPQSMVETIVFHVRDPKDVTQISLEDSASAVTTPAAMLGTDTPPTRIQLERFGKSSVVLARCRGSEGRPAPDQSAYEPLFRDAASIVASYRDVLGVARLVPEELARTHASAARRSSSSAGAKRSAGDAPAHK